MSKTVEPLTPEEEASFVAALQGTWIIRAVRTGEEEEPVPASTPSFLTKANSHGTAVVEGKRYYLFGLSQDMDPNRKFEFWRDPSTGRVYVDAQGSYVTTPGWPYEQPDAGKPGASFVLCNGCCACQPGQKYNRWTWLGKESGPGGSENMLSILQNKITASVEPKPASVEERLAVAKGLYDKGLLTEAEYEAKRNKIISTL